MSRHRLGGAVTPPVSMLDDSESDGMDLDDEAGYAHKPRRQAFPFSPGQAPHRHSGMTAEDFYHPLAHRHQVDQLDFDSDGSEGDVEDTPPSTAKRKKHDWKNQQLQQSGHSRDTAYKQHYGGMVLRSGNRLQGVKRFLESQESLSRGKLPLENSFVTADSTNNAVDFPDSVSSSCKHWCNDIKLNSKKVWPVTTSKTTSSVEEELNVNNSAHGRSRAGSPSNRKGRYRDSNKYDDGSNESKRIHDEYQREKSHRIHYGLDRNDDISDTDSASESSAVMTANYRKKRDCESDGVLGYVGETISFFTSFLSNIFPSDTGKPKKSHSGGFFNSLSSCMTVPDSFLLSRKARKSYLFLIPLILLSFPLLFAAGGGMAGNEGGGVNFFQGQFASEVHTYQDKSTKYYVPKITTFTESASKVFGEKSLWDRVAGLCGFGVHSSKSSSSSGTGTASAFPFGSDKDKKSESASTLTNSINQANLQAQVKSILAELMSEQSNWLTRGEVEGIVRRVLAPEMESLRVSLLSIANEENSDQAALKVDQNDAKARLIELEGQMAALQAKARNLEREIMDSRNQLSGALTGDRDSQTKNFGQLQKLLSSLRGEMDKLQSAYVKFQGTTKSCCINDKGLANAIETNVNNMLGKMFAKGGKASGVGKGGLAGWLADNYVERDEFDRQMRLLTADIQDRISVGIESQHRGASSSILSGSVPEDAVRLIVEEALLKYSADRTGMPDFALESAGGSVINSRCSATYYRRTSLISMFGIPLWYTSNSPRTVIQPDTYPGQCWAFKGRKGHIVIQLAVPIRPTGFSMEHIPKSLSMTGNIDSAPREFTVLGLNHEKDTHGLNFGNFTYQTVGKPIQYFSVQIRTPGIFEYVQLKVLNNHGNRDYTCLYRFRVHGVPQV